MIKRTMGHTKSRSSIFSSTINDKESFNWEEAKYGINYYMFCLLVTKNNQKYLIHHNPPLYGLLSYPKIYEWQIFNAYRLTDFQFNEFVRKTDIDVGNERFTERETSPPKRNTALNKVLDKEQEKESNILMFKFIILNLFVPTIMSVTIGSMMFFFEPLRWMFPIFVFLLSRFLYNFFAVRRIKKIINANVDKVTSNKMKLNISRNKKDRIIFKLLNIFSLPLVCITTIYFYILYGFTNPVYSWMLILSPMIGAICPWGYSYILKDSKIKFKMID